jgi:hypothetical protein
MPDTEFLEFTGTSKQQLERSPIMLCWSRWVRTEHWKIPEKCRLSRLECYSRTRSLDVVVDNVKLRTSSSKLDSCYSQSLKIHFWIFCGYSTVFSCTIYSQLIRMQTFRSKKSMSAIISQQWKLTMQNQMRLERHHE